MKLEVVVAVSGSSNCNKSMRGIKAVTVQLNTRPQHIGDGEAGGGRAPGAWHPNPRHPAAQVPRYRLTCHENCDVTWIQYQKILISEGNIIAESMSQGDIA